MDRIDNSFVTFSLLFIEKISISWKGLPSLVPCGRFCQNHSCSRSLFIVFFHQVIGDTVLGVTPLSCHSGHNHSVFEVKFSEVDLISPGFLHWKFLTCSWSIVLINLRDLNSLLKGWSEKCFNSKSHVSIVEYRYLITQFCIFLKFEIKSLYHNDERQSDSVLDDTCDTRVASKFSIGSRRWKSWSETWSARWLTSFTRQGSRQPKPKPKQSNSEVRTRESSRGPKTKSTAKRFLPKNRGR